MCSVSGKDLVFIAIDGDHVGDTLESLVARGQLGELKVFSKRVAAFFRDIRARFEEREASIYYCEGDGLLASMGIDHFDPILLHQLPLGPCTLSIGVGWDSREALMALKVAKAMGRNQVFSLIEGTDLT